MVNLFFSGATYCGDSVTQTPNASGQIEQCDDGNTGNGDGCDSLCQSEPIPPSCGLFQVQSGNAQGGIQVEWEDCSSGNFQSAFIQGVSNICSRIPPGVTQAGGNGLIEYTGPSSC